MTSRVVLPVTAAALTVAGELEVLLGPAGGDKPLVGALAVPAITLPLAWSRRAPLSALAAVALALFAQGALGGVLAGQAVTTLVALAIALYAAGRHVAGRWELAGVVGASAVIVATRIAFDPAAQRPSDAVVTVLAVACPLLVGRWARGQSLLQGELTARAARQERFRARDARHAAEEERARIAADLQVAVAGGLESIVAAGEPLRAALAAGDNAGARTRLAAIAATARAALADVRRVLGVLRRDGEPPRLAPSSPTAQAGSVTPPSPVDAGAPDADTAASAPGWTTVHGDRALAACLLAASALELALVAPDAQRLAAPLTAVAIAAPLLARRRTPVFAAAGVLGAIALQSLLTDLEAFPTANMAAMVCACYAIGAHAGREQAIAGLALMAAGATAHAAVFYPDGVVAAPLGGVILPWIVGRVVRGHRALTREGRRRTAEVEDSRARDARAAVTSERMRVARELHDAVAHNLSVIAIQAGGAEPLVERDPARAARCAELIATVAREASAELGRVTGLPVVAADGDGPPGLARVGELADRARAAGLAVALDVEERRGALPAGIDLAAFRIVQEALANAAKHAHAARVWVTVRHAEHGVELEIADDGRGAAGRTARPGGGHGIVGMRERAALYGGSLEAGPRAPAGGFLVRARLPL